MTFYHKLKLQNCNERGECDDSDSLILLQVIVSWIGSQANIFEKQKVREIASLIRDTDRHGKARIVDSNEGEEPEEMLKVNPHPQDFYYVIMFQQAVLHLTSEIVLFRRLR